MKYLIKGGRVIDPVSHIDSVMDVLVSGTKIEKLSKDIKVKGATLIDAKGKIVAPGLIDMHVHLREPGREDKETVLTGTRAAIKGGITSVSCMPNTEPATDDPDKVKDLKRIIKDTALSNVFIIASITMGREGRELTDIKRMKKEGVAALSDDGNSIGDASVMQKALKEAKKNELFIISHCEDKRLSGKGVINEGIIATKLGLRPIPRSSEYEIVKRDIKLAEETNARLHIAHISCKESVDILKKAKKKGINVTAEVTPHHFTLTDECCVTYDTNLKMKPPLRSKEDIEAIKKALKEGTIDAIASDHAPHGRHEKDVAFDFAAFGMIGLETSLALSIALVEGKILSWVRLVELMSCNPAKILGLKDKGSLSKGKDADIVIIDPDKKWTYKQKDIKSKSNNSPFIGWQFKGKADSVMVGGKLIKEA